jgi:Leucine-rich repeat (LRR) protein
MKSLIIVLAFVHQCYSQQAAINCTYRTTPVVGYTQYSCMILRQSIDPNAKAFSTVGEHAAGSTDQSVKGVLITGSQVPFISKALMDSFFDKFKILAYIEIFHSRVERIESGAFSKGVEVEEISIVFNKIARIEDGTFSGLKKLTYLEIQDSQVQQISENAFKDLESVKILRLPFNNIRELPKKVFSSMNKLERVEMNNNSLTTIDGDIFYNNENLQYVFFEYNRINTIGDNFLDGMLKFNTLRVNENVCVNASFSSRNDAMRGLSLCYGLSTGSSVAPESAGKLFLLTSILASSLHKMWN